MSQISDNYFNVFFFLELVYFLYFTITAYATVSIA